MEMCQKIRLGDIAEIKGGKRLPKGSNLSETPSLHPYIRTRDLSNNSINIENLLFVPDKVFPSIARYTVEVNDIIISIVGTIGCVHQFLKNYILASLTENCAKIVEIDEDILNKKYLFYYLISEDGQNEIKNRSVGSTQPKLPLY
jgi:type I restriction enzyme, S subunit